MKITEKISEYIRDQNINLSEMSRSTGISYRMIYASLADKSRNRALSVDEAVAICDYLGKTVDDFREKPERSEPDGRA
ncbi:helix-turn-helix domain-containing protein [Dorea sp. AF36-15AT]|uniref:helix-turn-helix domain-containing protein n=1 Tax=Dorea sp. AF36-15AT TaxID=2292041 RepID=UPI000E50BED5|nr:helix-turn-helix transcriptional regulator [Dorea sp. AF36-15AT]RHP05578.1 XRE family transcriptional regulator [Dorea sp. AF36-15AT]